MNESENDYRWFIEQRQEYAKIASEHLTRFERTILIASGGGVATLFGYISQMEAEFSSFGTLSIVFLGLCFFAILLSHYLSYLDNEHAIASLDKAYPNLGSYIHTPHRLSFLIEPLNRLSIVLLAVGYVSTICWLLGKG